VDLLERGHHVDVFPYVKCEDENPHANFVKHRLSEKTFPSGPTPPSKIKRLNAFLLFALQNPSKLPVLFRLLNFFSFGKDALNLTLFFAARPYLEKEPYNIYHGHFGESGVSLVKMKKAGVVKGKIVTTFHGYDAHFTPQNTNVQKAFYRDLFVKGDVLTVNSNYTSKQIVELGCPIEKIVKLPVGLDTEKYKPLGDKPSYGHKTKILSIGRLVAFKGHTYGIEAMAHLKRMGISDFEYKIIGDGELEEELRATITQLGLEREVRLVGSKSQEEIIQLMSEAHIFLHPAVTASNGRQENQGLVLQEAQAMEMAVIATRTGGIPEGVLENESALLIEEKDSRAIANALKYLIENKELISRFGIAGREYVKKHFDIKRLNDHLVDIYLD